MSKTIEDRIMDLSAKAEREGVSIKSLVLKLKDLEELEKSPSFERDYFSGPYGFYNGLYGRIEINLVK